MNANIAESRVDGASAPSQLFVINLCASTSPMALSHPSSPELKRYTFFVSRQREEGRERFRLHMGYFSTHEEAEALLVAVRDVYPAAWAGPAPSTSAPRRGRSAPAPAVVVAPATVVAPSALVVPTASVAPVAPAQQLESMSNVRDVLDKLSDEPRVAPAAPRPPVVVEPAAAPVPAAVIAAAPPAPVRAESPAAKVAPPVFVPRLQPVQPAAAAPPAPAMQVPAPELSAREALRVLETPPPAEPDSAEPDVRVVTPEDTQTLTDIRLDAQNNAPPCFAVQLVWSVSPIDVTTLPHLAIFDAYTLYNVEGNRQGRKWYGLRLGFFSDPNSATQVAHYVRSDYRSVAVVPVAIKERDRASGGAPVAKIAPRLGESAVPQKAEAALPVERSGLDGFELLTDDRPAPVKRDLDDTQAAPAAAAATAPRLAPKGAAAPAKVAGGAKRPEPPKAAGKPMGKRVVVRKRPEPPRGRAAPGAPQPLESTLEILGASTLTIDESREIINDSAVRQPLKKTPSGNRFSKLLSRLSGG